MRARSEEDATEEIRLQPGRCEVSRGGWRTRLRPTPFRLLRYLVEHRERYVPAAELVEAVWDGGPASETALATAIRDVRRALRDDPRAPRYVSTLRRVGYRFIGAVSHSEALRSAPGNPAALVDRALEVARDTGADLEVVDLLERARAGLAGPNA